MAETGEVEKQVLWRDRKTGKIIRKSKSGKLVVCWECPCCKPKVIASTVTNRRENRETWDLRPYQGEKMGIPGQRWRLRDVGESHHNNSNASCSGSQYFSGTIDAKGKLTGLPDKFVSNYSYNGYMELQMGCIREDGSVEWPCPNG